MNLLVYTYKILNIKIAVQSLLNNALTDDTLDENYVNNIILSLLYNILN
jgi:hypothetical protein